MDKITIEIDEKSGFCYGVVRAIEAAEKYLEDHGELISLGAIVHNDSEIGRLSAKGLRTKDSLEGLHDTTVLIRAHGEPPSTYSEASRRNIDILDCTCPVVLKLQQRIRQRYAETRDEDGQIIIFGKKGHAEVNGLVGQTDHKAIVIEKASDIENSGMDFRKKTTLFAQTTKDPEEYGHITDLIRRNIIEACGCDNGFTAINSICGQVSSRHPHLKDFAEEHSLIIFVSGKESSNGKVLYEICRRTNPRSYKIEKPSELNPEWIQEGDRIGICGATSTPKWQLQEVADRITDFFSNFATLKNNQ